MILKCKKNPTKINGIKVLEFTKGRTYEFDKINDPEGWETVDDNGLKSHFFRLDILFDYKHPELPTV